MQINLNVCSVHTDHPEKYKDLENAFYDWIFEKRESQIAVSTRNFIAKAFSHDSSSKDRDYKNLFHWVYLFLVRWKLSIWMSTRTGQKRNYQLLAVYEKFLKEIVSKFTVQEVYYSLQTHIFVNMDGTGVILEAKPTSIVHHSRGNTMFFTLFWKKHRSFDSMRVCCSFNYSSSSKVSQRVTLKNIDTILSSGIFVCYLLKRLIDQRSLNIWLETLWNLHVAIYEKSVLLLDFFACHKHEIFLIHCV